MGYCWNRGCGFCVAYFKCCSVFSLFLSTAAGGTPAAAAAAAKGFLGFCHHGGDYSDDAFLVCFF
ncbi:hypothetical protein GLYMA_14G047301v4 [Glycine max]|nr:hypothetical protein GLYMA_14G047301v4 [Glycine max]